MFCSILFCSSSIKVVIKPVINYFFSHNFRLTSPLIKAFSSENEKFPDEASKRLTFYPFNCPADLLQFVVPLYPPLENADQVFDEKGNLMRESEFRENALYNKQGDNIRTGRISQEAKDVRHDARVPYTSSSADAVNNSLSAEGDNIPQSSTTISQPLGSTISYTSSSVSFSSSPSSSSVNISPFSEEASSDASTKSIRHTHLNSEVFTENRNDGELIDNEFFSDVEALDVEEFIDSTIPDKGFDATEFAKNLTKGFWKHQNKKSEIKKEENSEAEISQLLKDHNFNVDAMPATTSNWGNMPYPEPSVLWPNPMLNSIRLKPFYTLRKEEITGKFKEKTHDYKSNISNEISADKSSNISKRKERKSPSEESKENGHEQLKEARNGKDIAKEVNVIKMNKKRLEKLWSYSSSYGISWDELEQLYANFMREKMGRTELWEAKKMRILEFASTIVKKELRIKRKKFLLDNGVLLEEKTEEEKEALLLPRSIFRRQTRMLYFAWRDEYLKPWSQGKLLEHLKWQVSEKMTCRELNERALYLNELGGSLPENK